MFGGGFYSMPCANFFEISDVIFNKRPSFQSMGHPSGEEFADHSMRQDKKSPTPISSGWGTHYTWRLSARLTARFPRSIP
jgi:hypothetical protein